MEAVQLSSNFMINQSRCCLSRGTFQEVVSLTFTAFLKSEVETQGLFFIQSLEEVHEVHISLLNKCL